MRDPLQHTSGGRHKHGPSKVVVFTHHPPSTRVPARPWSEDTPTSASPSAPDTNGSVGVRCYELVYRQPSAPPLLDARTVEQLGGRLDGWGAVDAFGRYISGPAWQRNVISKQLIQGWAASPDRWWRRAALVSTVPLNLRAAGGTGDAKRTLDICARLIEDRDDDAAILQCPAKRGPDRRGSDDS